MKKIIVNLALIGATTFGFLSCTQDDEVTKSSNNSSAANLMVFSSVEEYENLFAEPEKTDEKVSDLAARYGTYSENARVSSLPDTLYPEFLQKILNEDYIVQIDQWLIKVDAANERCLVLETKHKDQYSDLANSNLSNANILVYSTEDEVLSMLRDGIKSEVSRTQGLFCRGIDNNAKFSANHFIEPASLLFTYGTPKVEGNRYIRHAVDYNKYGIYFKLYCNVLSRFSSDGGYTFHPYSIDNLTLSVDAKWDKNCKYGGSDVNEYTVNNTYENAHTLYSGIQNISKSDVKLKAKTILSNGSIHETPVFTDYRTN